VEIFQAVVCPVGHQGDSLIHVGRPAVGSLRLVLDGMRQGRLGDDLPHLGHLGGRLLRHLVHRPGLDAAPDRSQLGPCVGCQQLRMVLVAGAPRIQKARRGTPAQLGHRSPWASRATDRVREMAEASEIFEKAGYFDGMEIRL